MNFRFSFRAFSSFAQICAKILRAKINGANKKACMSLRGVRGWQKKKFNTYHDGRKMAVAAKDFLQNQSKKFKSLSTSLLTHHEDFLDLFLDLVAFICVKHCMG